MLNVTLNLLENKSNIRNNYENEFFYEEITNEAQLRWRNDGASKWTVHFDDQLWSRSSAGCVNVGSRSHSISRSPKLSVVFLFNNTREKLK